MQVKARGDGRVCFWSERIFGQLEERRQIVPPPRCDAASSDEPSKHDKDEVRARVHACEPNTHT